MLKIRLTTRRERTRLSLETSIFFVLSLALLFILLMKGLNLYLAQTDKFESKLLVVEGFLPDYTLRNMMHEFHEGNYDKILITGKPIGQGYYLSGYTTSSDLMKSTLIEMGFDSTKIISISIPATVFRDRTYNTGLLLYNYLKKSNLKLNKINIYTLGCHARRSRILFQKAVGKEFEIGIIAGEDRSYDPKKWWKSSKGFRTVLNETLAYLYVRIVFHPDRDEAIEDLNIGYYIDEIQNHRNDKDITFAKKGSPLTDEQRDHFSQLNYFHINKDFKIKGLFVRDTLRLEFEMKTSTDRLPIYTNYGKFYFTLDGKECVLTAYQNKAYADESDYLFIPYRDFSNGDESYGGGRYLDLKIPTSDSLSLDFNLSYNPYCAYNHKYSCPIPPEENDLEVRIEAGEKSYDDH